jgi:hypothetical protein
MSDLSAKAYPCKRNQDCIDHEVGSYKPMNNDIVQWQIRSKQNSNHNVVAASDKIEVRGMRDLWLHP